MKNEKLLVLFCLLISIFGTAQMPILETPTKKGKYKPSRTVRVQEMNTAVKVVGNLATTTTTIVLKNHSKRLLEGRVTFPLPEGVSVSGYALDINGKLRNAVPVTKTKAKEVFESIQKRRVDPGLIEKVQGNNFRTRVYPINPNQTRTIQITYHQLLENEKKDFVYHLLTSTQAEIPSFKLNVAVFDQVKVPQLTETPDGNFSFQRQGNSWVAEIDKQSFTPNKNLTIRIPKKENVVKTIFQPASEGSAYFLANVNLPPNTQKKRKPQSIALVWDNSLSGLDRNHQKEFELLNAYFEWAKEIKIQVYLLNNTFTKAQQFTIKNGNWERLKSYLSNIKYDGGTDFGMLKKVSEDEVILFSDGVSTFGDFTMQWEKPVYSVVASTKANYQKLIQLSSKGGAMLNLNQHSPQKLVKNMMFQHLQFLGIEENTAVSDVVSSEVTINDSGMTIAGILRQPKTKLMLKFGYGNKVKFIKKIKLDAKQGSTNGWDIAKFWAQYKVADLERQLGNHQNEIEEIGKQFGIVTSNTSLMVLEDVQDYVRYKITPPDELRAEYDKITKNNVARLTEKRKGIMKNAEQMMVDLKKWWNTDFKPKKRYPKTNEKRRGRADNSADGVPPPPSSPMVAEAEETEVHDVSNALQGRVAGVRVTNRTNAVRLRGISSVKAKKEVMKPSGKVRLVDIKSDKEYMKFFEGKNPEEIYQVYLEHRIDYQTTPTYYFDVADLLWKERKDLALKVISSIADLDLENAELYKLLAYRLKKGKAYEKELWVTKKVLEWRPFDPQSYRDYALALEDNGEYQKALDNLYTILTQTYTQEILGRDTGIEETVLMEMNQLMSTRKSQLDISGINPKLIADLPVNIRVVLNWNKDNTDIDLWVTDPRGEQCYYSHKRTEIGGRLSKDFTGGFGPEQFLLKKAIRGKYKIETNFFAERQATVSGATALMAEVFIDYASGHQERKIVVFHSDKKKNSQQNKNRVFIGEFEF